MEEKRQKPMSKEEGKNNNHEDNSDINDAAKVVVYRCLTAGKLLLNLGLPLLVDAAIHYRLFFLRKWGNILQNQKLEMRKDSAVVKKNLVNHGIPLALLKTRLESFPKLFKNLFYDSYSNENIQTI